MPRIPELSTEQMDPIQKGIYDDIMAGPRSSLRGPFHAWLHSPGLADPAQKLGAFCRFSSSLPKRLSELAIIVVASFGVHNLSGMRTHRWPWKPGYPLIQ